MQTAIEFQKIKIEGFQTIGGPFEYKLNRPGLNIIMGSNGKGKTTILSALTWACWGKTLKKKNSVTPWKTKQSKNYIGTKVEVYFKDGKNQYIIISCESYKGKVGDAKGGNRLILMENGEPRDDLRNKDDIRAEIVSILGKSFDLAKNTIMFGQKLKRIIQESGPEKKKVFEEAFEANYINQAREVAKKAIVKEVNLLNTEFMPKKYSLEKKIESTQNIIKLQSDFNKNKQKRIDNINAKIARLRSNIKLKNHKQKIHELGAELKKMGSDKLEGRYKSAEHALFKAEFAYKTNKDAKPAQQAVIKEIAEEYNRVPKTCNNCGAALNAERVKFSKEKVKKRLNQAKKDLEDLELEIGQSKESYQVAKNMESSLKKRLDKGKQISFSIMELEAELGYLMDIKELEQDIKEIEEEVIGKKMIPLKEAKTLLKTLEVELAQVDSKIKKVEKKQKDYQWLIDVPLSNSGIKAYIFESMLKSVNNRLDYYSKYLKFKIEFGVDLSSSRKDFYSIVYLGPNMIDYEELSGGEQQLVDICIAFAIHDTLDEGNPINILVMDEVFESLDSENIEIVSDLINEKAKSKSIHLITHRTDFTAVNAAVLKME
jgi:DNA repair exonuclease SbcCD ATPase subunit